MALFLLVLLLTTFVFNSSFSSTLQKLQEALNNIERAVRFSTNEAILRNRIIRINFNISDEDHQFSVEYGPDANFILPKQLQEIDDQYEFHEEDEEEDQEEEEKGQKDKGLQILEKINRQFQKVEEFQEKSISFPKQVKIIAIGSNLRNHLIEEGNISLYFHPSGEKDSAIIILGTQNEMATLEIEAFTMDMETTIITLNPQVFEEEVPEEQKKAAQEYYQKWLKK